MLIFNIRVAVGINHNNIMTKLTDYKFSEDCRYFEIVHYGEDGANIKFSDSTSAKLAEASLKMSLHQQSVSYTYKMNRNFQNSIEKLQIVKLLLASSLIESSLPNYPLHHRGGVQSQIRKQCATY